MIVQNDYANDARVRRKAEALVEEGYCVDVIALRTKIKPSASKYELNGVTVYTLPLKKKRGNYYRYLYEYVTFFFMALIKVIMLMIRKRYKIIDVNTLPDFLVFSALIPKLMGAKILLDMHEIMPEFYMSKYGVNGDHWMIRLIRWQEKISMQFADYVLTINEPIQKLLESRGLNLAKSSIIMNSTNENLFDERKLKDFRRLNIKFIMMYHGTLTHIYGLDIALNAFARVHEDIPKAEFWIIGDGPEYENLERLTLQNDLQEKVKFFGLIPQDEIPKLVYQCDVGVLATRQDLFLDLSFSNKLSEYIAFGKPVIASRLKTVRRYFSEQALAYFAPQHTSDLAARMLEIYHNPKRRQKLSRQAKLEYQPIRWNVMRRRYLNLVKNLNN